MMDRFANFVVQRFFEIGTKKQREEIIEIIMENFQPLCFDIYGCRVIQFVMDSLTDSDQKRVLLKLKNNVVQFARDQFGHHILIKCFSPHLFLSKKDLTFIVYEFSYNIGSECGHQYSCRVFQEILECGTVLQKILILDQILPAVEFIATHRYGNYVLQSTLSKFGF